MLLVDLHQHCAQRRQPLLFLLGEVVTKTALEGIARRHPHQRRHGKAGGQQGEEELGGEA